MSDKSVLEMTCGEAAREIISFMDEMDEAVSRGLKQCRHLWRRIVCALSETERKLKKISSFFKILISFFKNP